MELKEIKEKLLDRYGDDIYRFAFVLTRSDATADKLVPAAFAYADEKQLDQNDDENKLVIFKLIYAAAEKLTSIGMSDEEITAKYGKKSEDFLTLLRKPLKERAAEHLSVYEDLTAEQIKEITG